MSKIRSLWSERRVARRPVREYLILMLKKVVHVPGPRRARLLNRIETSPIALASGRYRVYVLGYPPRCAKAMRVMVGRRMARL
jgi:hypothetical protein